MVLSFVFFCKQASAKCKYLFYRRIYSTNLECFVVYSSCLHLTFEAFCLLSVICKQELKNITTTFINQRSWPDSGQTLYHQYEISVAEARTSVLAICPQRQGVREVAVFAGLKNGRHLLALIWYCLYHWLNPTLSKMQQMEVKFQISVPPSQKNAAFIWRLYEKNLVKLDTLHHLDNYNSISAKKVTHYFNIFQFCIIFTNDLSKILIYCCQWFRKCDFEIESSL